MSESTTTVETPAATPATPAKAKAKKATKPAGKKGNKNGAKATPARTDNSLTGNEVKILTALFKSGKPMTRADLAKKTGINKGWSRVLGSSTKEDGGMSGDESLEGRGLVKCERHEGERSLSYTITARGKAELAKAAAK